MVVKFENHYLKIEEYKDTFKVISKIDYESKVVGSTLISQAINALLFELEKK